MVERVIRPLTAMVWLLAQEKTQSAVQRMDPATRSKLFFAAFVALIAFVLLWFSVIALAWLGARVTKRYMNQGSIRRRDLAHFQDDWASKPLVPPEPAPDDEVDG